MTLYFLAQEKGINLGYRVNVDEIAQSIGDYKDKKTLIRASKIALTMCKVIRMTDLILIKKLRFVEKLY